MWNLARWLAYFYVKYCKITYNGNDVTPITPGAWFDDFCNDLKKIFLSWLCSPSIVSNLPPFSMVCTLVCHRNDATKCSKLGSETTWLTARVSTSQLSHLSYVSGLFSDWALSRQKMAQAEIFSFSLKTQTHVPPPPPHSPLSGRPDPHCTWLYKW